MTKIAVCSRSFSRHPQLRAELLARYPETRFNDAGLQLAGDALIKFIKGCDRAVIALEPIDATVLDALPELRVISKYGVGFDKLDVAALKARGIALGWTPGVNRRSVTELTLCFMISLLRHIPQGDRAARTGKWAPLTGHLLSDRIVGVIGCGNIGKDLTRLLRTMGSRVLVHDIADVSAFCAETGAEPVSLTELLTTADIVTLHVPLNDETRYMIDHDRLATMKPSSLLINTARGSLVDETALAEALASDQLAGAAFDVFDQEPLVMSPLTDLDNFLATAHIGGSTEESILAMGRAAIAGLDENRIPEPDVFPK